MKTKTEKTIRRIELSALAGLVIAIVLSITSFGATCKDVRQDVLRMHVIANSDSEADQTLKLKVRDAVLAAGEDAFDGSLTADAAKCVLSERRETLLAAARQTIAENGYDYDVQIEIGKDFFSTRVYDDRIALPAGEYEAVRVIIGSGAGKNWWCVMFPPMCLPAAESRDTVALEEVLSQEEMTLVESNPKYEPRFKIIEIYEKIANKFK